MTDDPTLVWPRERLTDARAIEADRRQAHDDGKRLMLAAVAVVKAYRGGEGMKAALRALDDAWAAVEGQG